MPSTSRTVDHEQLTTDKNKSSVKCSPRFASLDSESERAGEAGQVSSVRKTKGFTLIELLVVIALIGILASFGVASFNSAQQKGRDSKRKADFDAMKNALELAKSDSTGGGYYPACDVNAIVDGTANSCNVNGQNTNTNPDLAPSSNYYIKAMPTDPKGTGEFYVYTPGGTGCTAATPNTCTTYTLRACLENVNDPQRVAADGAVGPPADPCSATGRVGYQIASQ